ncbi:hypothetical protein GDO78_006237 [Eleutherodactylus coqui]|uniref:Uncharacterized protein n=1 Tax=Eleutherodactylus coqui TaxID=57060 RepID=A0A8J6FMR4_ELECQ|nr:hypothetical protein GDO78_006237 [Eleutherodactylus coqui]
MQDGFSKYDNPFVSISFQNESRSKENCFYACSPSTCGHICVCGVFRGPIPSIGNWILAVASNGRTAITYPLLVTALFLLLSLNHLSCRGCEQWRHTK